jgi:hypothetical protein
VAFQHVLLAGTLLAAASSASLSAQVRETPFGLPQGEPQAGPTLNEAIRFSQIFQNSPQTGQVETSSISGDVDYTSGSVRRPFALLYAGGGIFTTDSMGNTIYQNIQLSQGFVARNWNLAVGNIFSYLPETPTSGLAGIPGVGDLSGSGGILPPGIAPDQSVLASNASRYSEAISADLERRLDSSTSLEGSAAFGLLRFPGGNGINSEQESGSIGINRRLNPLNILSADFRFSRFQFTGLDFSFEAPSVALDYKRQWNRTWQTDISFGPEWVRSSNPAVLPNRLLVAGSATLSFQRGQNGGVLSYTRGTSGGSGALGGAALDDFQVGFSRNLDREWTVAATASWARTAALQTGPQANATSTTPGGSGSLILPAQSEVNAEYGGLQLTRRINRHLTAYLSYTAQYQSIGSQDQSAQAASGGNGGALRGLSNIIGFGFGYTPRDRRIRRQ